MKQPPTPILKRIARPWPHRHALFVKLDRGAIHENGEVIPWHPTTQGERMGLTYILDMANDPGWIEDGKTFDGRDSGKERKDERPSVVYIVGGWDAASMPPHEWFQVPGGWQFWERTVYHRDPLIAVYRYVENGPDHGRKITIYSTAQWFGECDNASLCRKAYTRLRQLLRSTFDPGADLLGTPARTGLDLLARSLPRNKDGKPYEYPVLDETTRERLEHNIGQGRIEFLPMEGVRSETDTLYVLDANWMYAACIRHLPAPPLEHDWTPEFAGYRCGFYRVFFRVPEGWQHIGLLPTWDRQAKHTIYPTTNLSEGAWYEAYVCGEELRLAIEQGWSIEIKERWLFADDRASNADPTRAWAEHLRMLRGAVSDAREGQIGPLLRFALRALCIKAIGGLHRKGRTEQVETPHDRAEEVDPSMVLEITPTMIRWERPIPLAPEMAMFNHPEWAAIVWGRARARLARAALQLPRSSIVALRSDAIVATLDPGWPDDGKPGTFRVKRRFDLGGQDIPQDERAYRRMLRGLKDG
jgi:hypothetical protein